MAGYNRDDAPPGPVLPGRKSFAVTAMHTVFLLQTRSDTTMPFGDQRSQSVSMRVSGVCVAQLCSNLEKNSDTHPDRCPLLKVRRRTSVVLPHRRADRSEMLLHRDPRCSPATCMSCKGMLCMVALPAGSILSRCPAMGRQSGLTCSGNQSEPADISIRASPSCEVECWQSSHYSHAGLWSGQCKHRAIHFDLGQFRPRSHACRRRWNANTRHAARQHVFDPDWHFMHGTCRGTAVLELVSSCLFRQLVRDH
jgi:hypothetical protein